MTSGDSSKYVWKIENFSSLSSKRHYSEIFSACGIKWTLCIEPKGLDQTHKSPAGGVVKWNRTKFIMGIQPYGTGSWYVEYRLSVIDLKDREQTRNFDNEREMRAACMTFCEAMHLTELLDPKRGFLVDDIFYIKVHIISAMKIVRTYQPKPEPVQALTGVTIQALTAKNEKTGHSKEKKEKADSVEAMIQSAGDSSMSVSNKKPGENQHTEAKVGEKNFSLSRWFQQQKENIGKYFDDDGTRYQRLPHE